MKNLIILLATIALCSCHSTKMISMQDSIKADNIGKTTAEIIEKLGAPDRETTDGREGKILVYESKSTVGKAITTYYGVTSYSSYERKEFMQFFMDKNTETCYDVRTNINKKERVFSAGKTVGLCAGIAGAAAIIVLAGTSSSE